MCLPRWVSSRVSLPAAFTRTTGMDHWLVLLRARAIENQVFLIAPDQFGKKPHGRFKYGKSAVIDPWGSVVDITRQTALLGIFALGAAIVIISGGIDLSSGSVIAFSGTICATLMLLLAPEEMAAAKPLGVGVIAAAIAGTLLIGFLIGSCLVLSRVSHFSSHNRCRYRNNPVAGNHND